MVYKIETHLHTIVSSSCGKLTPEEILLGYKKGGYKGLVVTDHLNRSAARHLKVDLSDKKEAYKAFFQGFLELEKISRDEEITTYLGAELRFDDNQNDFLIYGFTPDLFYDLDTIFKEGLAKFYPKAKAHGAIIIQAHPFRNGCFLAESEFLDGIEAFNLNIRHENNNADAYKAAKKHHLSMISGSDCHRSNNMALGGIITDILPKDSSELTHMIKRKKYLNFTTPVEYLDF
ncbi:MAG: PHP domain-containing protein [Spirochaetia bacterium]|nr:PHP domain-containing protein [Spirochaetia bacterium]